LFLPVSFFLLCSDQNSLTVVMSIWIKHIHWNQILISLAITHLLGIEIGCHSLVAKCPNLLWKMLVHSVHKSRGINYQTSRDYLANCTHSLVGSCSSHPIHFSQITKIAWGNGLCTKKCLL
jgi:hypothetical protein